MSETLAGGKIWIKTRAGIAATAEGPFHQFLWDGTGPMNQMPLHEAADAIYEITHAADTYDSQTMQDIRTYIKGLNLEAKENSDGQGQHGKPLEKFMPSSIAWAALKRVYESNGEADIEFLGVKLTSSDFALLTDYVMTNTVLWSEDPKAETDDPRLAMVEKFRSEP
jgi:hypothetical protein